MMIFYKFSVKSYAAVTLKRSQWKPLRETSSQFKSPKPWTHNNIYWSPLWLYKSNLPIQKVKIISSLLYTCSWNHPPYIYIAELSLNQHRLREKMKSFSNQIRGYLLANNYQLLLFYCLAAMSSCCLCCLMSPVFACMKVFVFVSVPQLMSSSLFFTSKFFFIVGNLIVIFLVGESKSKSKTKNKDKGFFTVDDQYSSCCCGDRLCYGDNECDLEPKSEKFLEVSRDIVSGEPKQGWVEEEKVDVNKRAEDFIARINMWRLREAAQDVSGLSQWR